MHVDINMLGINVDKTEKRRPELRWTNFAKASRTANKTESLSTLRKLTYKYW